MIRALSSPNRVTWLLAESARELASEAESADDMGKTQRRAVAAIVVAVACVESFINAQARLLLLRGNAFPRHAKLEREVKGRSPLGRKLKEWPRLMYEIDIDFEQGPGKAFKAVVEHRNKLMHFSTDVEAVATEGVEIHGLMDTTVFDDIEPMYAWSAVLAAEGFIEHLLRLAGTPSEEIPHALHHWLGTLPPRAA